MNGMLCHAALILSRSLRWKVREIQLMVHVNKVPENNQISSSEHYNFKGKGGPQHFNLPKSY